MSPLSKIRRLLLQASFLLIVPQSVLSDDPGNRISRALERAYEGSRYDQLEASVDQCIVNFHRRDSGACSDGRTIQANSYFVDLRHHSIKSIDQNARAVDGEWRIYIELEPKGEWKTRANELDRAKDKLLRAARQKFGSGQQAAIAATEDFLLNHNIDSFHSLSTVEYCPMGQAQKPRLRPIQLQGEYIDELTNTFEKLIADCRAI